MKRNLVLVLLCLVLCAFGPVRRYIQKAEFYVEKGNLKAARSYYMKALARDSMNLRANYGLGLMYSELLENYEEALPYLERANQVPVQDSLYELYYALAKCYHHFGQFEKAIGFYSRLENVVPEEGADRFPGDIKKRVEECRYALERAGVPPNPNQYVVNAGPHINTDAPEYVPVLTNRNTMIFTSKRQDGSREQLSYLDGKYHESMYSAEVTPHGFGNVKRFALPGELTKPRHVNRHQSVVSLSQDGKKLFTFRKGSIYEINADELESGESKKLATTFDSKFYQNHAFLTADGNTLYFTSDADGGTGGLDIYRCTKDQSGKWNAPENLGAPINTVFDEDAPFLSSDGKSLYFASKGHPGFGNFDLYRSDWNGSAWSQPENLGRPINSPGHDIFLVRDSSGLVTYFSSGRIGGYGDMDIYRMVDLEKFNRECTSPSPDAIASTIVDADSSDYRNTVSLQLPPNYSLLEVQWRVNETPVQHPDVSFEYDYKLPGSYAVSYTVMAGCDTCFFPVLACNTITNELGRASRPATVEPLPLAFDINSFKGELNDEQLEKIGFNGTPVYFGFDKAAPEAASLPLLDQNVAILKKHRQLIVKVVGFTDSRGSLAYNQRLSERRAKSVVKYLIGHGVDPAQISETDGRGANDFVNNCGKGVRCSENDHRLNRRVTLTVSIRP